MPPVVVQPVVPPAVMASHQHRVSVVMPNIMRRPALPADDRPPSHSFLVKIDPSIVVTVSRRSVLLVVSAATTRAATVEAVMALAEMVVVAVIDAIAATIAIPAGRDNYS